MPNTRFPFSPEFIKPVIIQIAGIAIVLTVLVIISQMNYVVFHSIVEVATIAIAISIFVIVWNARDKIDNGYFIVVGLAILFIGIIDFIHTIAYKGMGVFPGNSSDLPTQLWIAARYLQAFTLLAAPLMAGRRVRTVPVLAIFSAATVVLLWTIYAGIFPACFIEGQGLTPFKIGSEYAISLILIAATALLYWKRAAFDPRVFWLLASSNILSIGAELAFTAYVSVYGFMNMLGHLFRLVATYCMYLAIVAIGIREPYNLLWRNMNESETRYREFFTVSLDAVFITSPEGRWIDFNDATLELFGYESREELSKVSIATLYADPEKRTEFIHLLEQTGYVKEHPMRLKQKDGTIIDSIITSVSVRNTDGSVKAFIGTIRDITERKLADEERARLSAIVEHSDEAIIGETLGGIVTSWNTGAEQMYGYSAQEIVGKNVTLLVPPDHPNDTVLILERVKNGKPVIRYETLRRKKDGGLINVTLTASPIRDTQNHLIGTSIIGHDITERRRAEEALQQVNKQLNLLSSITRHDILNQLMALKGYLELSHRVIDNPTILAGYIQKEENAAKTIEDQIKFTKDYQDLGAAAPAWQNVNASIKKAVARLPMRDVRVDVDPAHPELFADPLFERVFYNLIDNALKYGGDDMKTIRFSSQGSDAQLTIFCEDDGVGISAEDKKRLFTRGFGKNTGLGLFLSREILSITGITINETGIPGKGARFEITVPKGMWRIKEQVA